MSKLLVVLPFCANDAILCENMVDLIALHNDRMPRGHCLIVAAPDTHGETQTKIRIAAEVAFETVDFIAVPWPKVIPTIKAEAVNTLFYESAIHAARSCQWPFLWLEPDCVPLKENWLAELTEAYYNQPKRYFGSILASQDGKTQCLSRVAIYPRGAGGEMKEFLASKAPFEIAAGGIIVPRSGKSKLFQQLAYTSASPEGAIRGEALILHHDKAGILTDKLLSRENEDTNGLITPAQLIKAGDELSQLSAKDLESVKAKLESKLPPGFVKRGPGRPRKELATVNG